MKLTRTLMCSIIVAGSACAPALAALGGGAASVEADRASLNGSLRVSSAAGYTVHEITTPAGLIVHEYLTSGGQVFAVSWHGPTRPDLRQMLGSSFGEFQQARAKAPPSRDHRHMSVETPALVVHSSGHLRTFTGRAWLPARLPENFSVSDIN